MDEYIDHAHKQNQAGGRGDAALYPAPVGHVVVAVLKELDEPLAARARSYRRENALLLH